MESFKQAINSSPSSSSSFSSNWSIFQFFFLSKKRNNLILKPRLSLKEEIIKSPFSPEFSCLSKIHLRFGKSATLLTNDLPNDMTPKDNGDEYLPGRNPGNEPNGIFEKGLEQLQHVLAHKRFPVLFLRSLRNSTQNLKTFKDMDLLRGESGKALAEEIRDLSFKLIEKNKNLATDRPAQGNKWIQFVIYHSYFLLFFFFFFQKLTY